MTKTKESKQSIGKLLNRIVGRFGGGYAFEPSYIHEMGDTLMQECPTMAVFRTVASELLDMDPTGPDGRRRAPTPYDVRRLAREKTPAEKSEECPDCHGTGYRDFDLYRPDPCGTGMAKYHFVRRCHCGTVYRPLKEPENATMANVAGLIANGGGR